MNYIYHDFFVNATNMVGYNGGSTTRYFIDNHWGNANAWYKWFVNWW